MLKVAIEKIGFFCRKKKFRNSTISFILPSMNFLKYPQIWVPDLYLKLAPLSQHSQLRLPFLTWIYHFTVPPDSVLPPYNPVFTAELTLSPYILITGSFVFYFDCGVIFLGRTFPPPDLCMRHLPSPLLQTVFMFYKTPSAGQPLLI